MIPSLWSNHNPHSAAHIVEWLLLMFINQNHILLDAWLTFKFFHQRYLGMLRADQARARREDWGKGDGDEA